MSSLFTASDTVIAILWFLLSTQWGASVSPSQAVVWAWVGAGGRVGFLGALSSSPSLVPWWPCPASPKPLLPGDTHNFLQKPLLNMAPWALLPDKNLNNGWYLYIAYLQGAKGTSLIFSTTPPHPPSHHTNLLSFSILILSQYL